MIGTRLGAFLIREEIGAGGMGRVYRADVPPDSPLHRQHPRVAVKVLHAHLLSTTSFLARFLREAEVGRTLIHPNLVRTLDVDAVPGHDPPVPYLVMEYVEGQTLRGLLAEMGRVPEELCLHIAREVTRALVAIHEAGVVHRDLKPENVLITPEHVVKVMDLGMAQLADETVRLSESGSFQGSLPYAAPEQFAASGRPIDGRTDLHALGVILYELATGIHPFAGADFRQTFQRILTEVPPPVGRLNPQLSAFFEEVVRTLLEKEPERRFATAADLLAVLEEGERTTWWTERIQAIRLATLRPPRRVRVPRETALYGRDKEMAALEAVYARVAAGHGQMVLVEGEAGIGKTRLIDEFVGALMARGENLNFLFGTNPPGGAATSTAAFTAAFREHFGVEGLAESVGRHLHVTPLLVPAFAALLRGDAVPSGSEPLTRESLPTVFVHVARSLAEERPTVILIEDLHFAPDEGRTLFAALALAVAEHRVLLVGTARPGAPDAWRAGLARLAHASFLRVQRLGQEALAALLADAFGSVDLGLDLAPQIATKSDGNPFFIFEILRELREGRFLTRDGDGTWKRTQAIAEIQIPSSVLDLVQARIGNLDEEDRELLEAAACAGFEFDPALVAEALGAGLIPTLRRFAKIEREGRLVRAVGRRYAFDHHQVQEVLHAGIFPALREQYHAALGSVLERREQAAEREPETLAGSLAVALCEHFLNGAVGEKARRYLDAALQHLAATYANAAAIELADRALAFPDLLAGRERCLVLLAKATRLDFAGRSDEERAALEEAAALARAIGDPGLEARVVANLGWHHGLARQSGPARELLARAADLARQAGDRREEASIVRRYGDLLDSQGQAADALPHLERALALAVEIGDRSEEAKVTGDLGVVVHSLGRYEEARQLHERCLALSRELGHRMGEAAAEGNLGVVLADIGHPGCIEHHERQLAICREIGYRRGEAIATGNVGTRLFDIGRLDEARLRFERHLQLSREIGFRQGEAIATGNLAVLFSQLGRLADALEWDKRHLALCHEQGYRRGEAIANGNLGDVLLLLGEIEAARTHHQQSLQIARAIGARDVESFALHSVARSTGEAGETAMVEPTLRAALEIRRDLGFQPGVAASLLDLGAWLVRAGRVDEARPALEEALALAREVDAPDEELLAAAHLAVLPGGDSNRALALYATREARLGVRIKMHVHFLLWKSTGESFHLAQAYRLLIALRDCAPPANRGTLMERVLLHREIAAAWAGRAAGSKAR